jgi:hypothetical protein
LKLKLSVAWFFDGFLARCATIATIYAVTCSIAGWVASVWDIATLGPTARWWITFAVIGLIVPTAVLSLVGLLIWPMVRTQAIADLEVSHQTARNLAHHLLQACQEDIEYLCLELSRERGSGFLRAMQQQHSIVQMYAEMCRKHYRRDRDLLKRICRKDSHVVHVAYTDIKDRVLAFCADAEKLLATQCQPNEAREYIRQAASTFKECALYIEKAVEKISVA